MVGLHASGVHILTNPPKMQTRLVLIPQWFKTAFFKQRCHNYPECVERGPEKILYHQVGAMEVA